MKILANICALLLGLLAVISLCIAVWELINGKVGECVILCFLGLILIAFVNIVKPIHEV